MRIDGHQRASQAAPTQEDRECSDEKRRGAQCSLDGDALGTPQVVWQEDVDA